MIGVPSTGIGTPATEKQVEFIENLYEQKSIKELDDDDYELLERFMKDGGTKSEASHLIKELLSIPDREGISFGNFN